MKKPLALRRVLTPLWSAALIALAMLGTNLAFAQDASPPDAAVSAEAPAAAPADAAAPAEAAPAEAEAAAAPTFEKGDVAWMLVSTAFVLFMTVPGLALFYTGMVRTKNSLSTVMQSFTIFCVIGVLWIVFGYSAAFTAGNPFFGTLDKLFMHGVDLNTAAATFSKGVYIPDLVFCVFQLTFAAITVALICGGYAERFKFSAMLIFSVLWFIFSYIPMAHMVWYWDGPDAYIKGSQEALDTATSHAGFLFAKGAIDFAGGTVVHINAGIAALVCALVLGPRKNYGKVSMAPHSLMMSAVGTGMLWMGWFGFNAGSALEANGFAALAFINTFGATAAAVLAWSVGEALHKGKASMLGAASGAVAGLVAITPAAGNVGIGGALVIGLLAGFVCLWGVTGLKKILGADDTLDVFGVHGVGGILGAILTGVFNSPSLGGPGFVADWVTATGITAADYSIASQVWIQTKAVLVTVVWSGVVSFVSYKVVDLTIGLRVSEEDEREGLDITSHGETAYNR